MQPKAITLASIKPNQHVDIFLKFLTRGDAASGKNRNFQGNTQQLEVSEQDTNVLHR